MKTIEFVLKLLLLLRFFSSANGAIPDFESHSRIMRAIRKGSLEDLREEVLGEPDEFRKFKPAYLMMALQSWTRDGPYSFDREQICDLLIGFLDDKNPRNDPYTPLICAALTNDRRAVIKAIRMGADVNGTNERGETALIVSICSGAFEAAQELLEYAADVNAVDGSNKSVLHYACEIAKRADRERAILLLLNNAADVSLMRNLQVRYEIDYCRVDLKKILGLEDVNSAFNADEYLVSRLMREGEDFRNGMLLVAFVFACGMASLMRAGANNF